MTLAAARARAFRKKATDPKAGSPVGVGTTDTAQPTAVMRA